MGLRVMLPFALAVLAGALIMGCAVECWRIVDEYDRKAEAELERRRIVAELARHDRPQP